MSATRRTASWGRALAWWSVLIVLLLVAMGVGVQFGATKIHIVDILLHRAPEADLYIFLTLRLPRVLFGALVGGGLALAGAVYQALLRNDLAEPYTLGVAGGASFGALAVMNFAPVAVMAYLLPVSSFFFGGCAVMVIYTMARLRRASTSPATLILAGVTMNLIFASGILAVQFISDPYQTVTMIRWLMGGVDGVSMQRIGFVAVVMAIAVVVLVMNAQALNLLSFGDLTAAHLGIDIERKRLILLVSSSAVAAISVAYAGPIGFVGLIIPHVMRRIVGSDHRVLLVACALGGATFLVVCDAVARSLFGEVEVPVGIITSFLGGPFFLWILFRRK